jgi:hypothetical protein
MNMGYRNYRKESTDNRKRRERNNKVRNRKE